MADTITTLTVTNLDGSTTEQIQIAHDDGSFTVMLKSTYDAQQTAQANSTES